ncbi:hypothetical protein P886_2051 [Alteromonadaceae bacterium 2753L.S.0a.02]|nr:hypothetical protein P886_2051 [Alteromonadaceae bacterium 2753L.S.0a.02]
MINSVMSEGLRGMQHSQREMLKSAQDIAEANIREEPSDTVETQTVTRADPVAPVQESARSDSGGDIVEPLIELRRQEQLFDASAKIVSVASDALGSLIDVES